MVMINRIRRSAALSPANTRGNALRWPAHALPRPAHRPPPSPLRAAPALIFMDFHCERVMQKWCSVRMSPRGDTAGGAVWWYAKPHFSNTRCDRVFPWYTAPYTVFRFRWLKALSNKALTASGIIPFPQYVFATQ